MRRWVNYLKMYFNYKLLSDNDICFFIGRSGCRNGAFTDVLILLMLAKNI